MKYHIYADHAATTQMAPEAWESMKPYLVEEYGNPSSLYRKARNSHKAVEEARNMIADCIGVLPEEIFFTSGGSESDNWALKGAAFSFYPQSIHIITSSIEHHAILHSCDFLRKMGHDVSFLSVDSHGIVSGSDLRKCFLPHTKLVSVMLANNETGTVEPVREFARIAHEHGAIFHTDAVQAWGHIPVNLRELDVDMASASAHKFNGPKGTGFLYLRKGIKLVSLIHGGAQENGRRAGTENVASIVGMAKALQVNCLDMEKNMAHLKKLRRVFQERMGEAGLAYRIHEAEENLPGIISVSLRKRDGEQIMHRLDLMGISLSTGSACNSRETEVSHVLRAIGVPEEYAYGTIRISLGKENTVEDVCNIVEALRRV